MRVNNIKLVLGTLVCVVFIGSATAQVLSPANIRNINVANLSNQEVEQIKKEMDNQNMSIETAEGLAMANGMTAQDFSILKARLAATAPQAQANPTNVEGGVNVKEQVIQMDEAKHFEVYGAEFFNNATLSFEPNSSMATPASYVLGPGDEIQLIIYGMQEYAGIFPVSKEGYINIPVVGQIHVSGLNFEAAKTQIKTASQKAYQSLATGQSQISLSLAKIRSIRITIIGAKKPGNYSVSSLSTVFNALHIAGGPSNDGSYRKIELIRKNKVIKVIDIYRFLTTGSQEDNINLEENDVIRIPVYENRVKIEGNVKRSGIFELLPNETFNDLLNYAGGFDEAAYRKNIKLIQNSNKDAGGIKVFDLTEDKYKSYKPQLGDVIKVSPILAKFENKVSIKGSVYRPDDYEFVTGMTVKSLVEKAEGVTQDAYLTHAILIREKEDLTKEITYVNLKEVLGGEGDIPLRKNDELVISSLFEFNSKKVLHIHGEVKNPGEYPYIENIKLYDLILMAGGFTDGASRVVEVTSMIIKDAPSGQTSRVSDVKVIEIDTLLVNQGANVALSPYDVVTVRKKPTFEKLDLVTINGQVEYPGSYVISDKNERVLDFINRAGGLKYYANPEGLRVIRTSEVANTDGTKGTREVVIPINYDKIIRHSGSKENFILQRGDVLIVPEKKGTVGIFGQVQLSSEIPYFSKKLKKYINYSGGFGEHPHKKRIYVIQPNGLAKATKRFLGIPIYPSIKPGSSIIVPTKPAVDDKGKITAGEWAVIASVITSLASTSAIVAVTLTK